MNAILKQGGGEVGVEVERGHPQQLVPGVPQALARPAVHVQHAGCALLVQEEPVGSMVHERPEPLLAGPQRLLGVQVLEYHGRLVGAHGEE